MELEEQVKSLDQKVTKILHLLSGTDLDPSQGFIFQFVSDKKERKALEDRIIKLERLKDKAIWVLAGMALPAGYGIASAIAGLLDLLFKK